MKKFQCVFLSLLGLMSPSIQSQKSQPSVWHKAEKGAENAVVQVIAHCTKFNWLEPYKAPQKLQGAGSAFFINKEGYLLTNFHVVDGAKSLELFVPGLGKKPMDAEVVSVCPESDVALIKLKTPALRTLRSTLKTVPFLALGDSDALLPTEPVLALGYPLGQRYRKSTVGVVAGMREYMEGKSFIHITAPINPGNSGGPLLNLDGDVVGINSAGVLSAQNMGYIVPIYDAMILLEEMKKTKLVRKPFPGMRYNATTEEHARLLGNPLPAGLFINAVEKGSVAQKAGIEAGDMLYEVNGCAVDSYGDVVCDWNSVLKTSLDEFFVRIPSNKELNLVVYRKGKKMELTTTYTAGTPESVREVYPDYEPEEIAYEVLGGACFMQLRMNHLDRFRQELPVQKYRLSQNLHKEVVVITNLLPGSTIHKTNCFYEGALLSELNGKPVKNLVELRDALQESSSTGLVTIKTKDDVVTVVSVDALLKDEERLNKDFMFTSTKAIRDLKSARKKNVLRGDFR